MLLDDETRKIVNSLRQQGGDEKVPDATLEWQAAAIIERQHAQIMAAIALSYEGHAAADPKCGCLKCRIRHVLRGHAIDPDPVAVMQGELSRLSDKI